MSDIDRLFGLDGKVALITGARTGLGRAMAIALARAGADIVGLGSRPMPETADEIAATGRRFVEVLHDLTDPARVAEVVSTIEGKIGAVDILVNNAGLQHVAPVEEFPPDRFALLLRVMLEAPFRLARAALPHMYDQGWGRLVHVSSVHGLRASPHKSAYVAAKHGLEGLSKVVALEGGDKGVTSNCVNPAYVRTPLVERQITDQARTHGIEESEVVEDVMLAPVAVMLVIARESNACAES